MFVSTLPERSLRISWEREKAGDCVWQVSRFTGSTGQYPGLLAELASSECSNPAGHHGSVTRLLQAHGASRKPGSRVNTVH